MGCNRCVIKCEIKSFHYAADKIMNKTLDAMELVLGEKMADDLPDGTPHVLDFKKIIAPSL